MPLLVRLRYALYLAIAFTMIASLAVAVGSADGIALLPSAAFEFALGPWLFVACYALSFVVTPWVADRLPIKRDWQ